MKTIDDIKKVCVVGAGAMGRQIALNTALYGYEVTVTDGFPETITKAVQWLDSYLVGRVEKGKMDQPTADAAKGRVKFLESMEEAAKDADLVIEAIIEDVEIKRELFAKLDKIVAPDAILSSNSSSIPSSRFADCVSNPQRLANLHYFNPALVMKLTEVVQGTHTSEDTIKALMEFSVKTGKKPVWVRKEIDGFIANRILRAINDEALFLVQEGICSAPDVDTAVENGLNHPMGPFRLNDLVGLDVSYYIKKRNYEETGNKPIGYDLYEEKINKGELGKKTGKGWYDYSDK